MTIKSLYPSIRPTLNLDFAKTKSLDPRITFTRASTATYVGSNGLIQTAASGVARFDHNPTTGESLGLLVEPARTNLLLNSATLSTQSATVTAASTTLSFYGTGTITLTGVSTAGPLVGTGANNRVSLIFTPTAGSLTLTVSGSVTNAQLETGSSFTSYIPTTSSTATRAADVATLSNTGSSVFPTSAFTTVNSPFGTAGGSSTLKLVGPTVARTAVYNTDLTQAQINALAGVNDNFWRWRVLGSSFALPTFTTNGSVTVDWGDGTVQTLTTGVYTFTNGGGYHDIGFRLNSGTFFKPNIANNATYKDRVIAVGPAPASMKVDGNAGLYGCANLRGIDGYADYTGSTNLTNAWRNCSSLASFPLIATNTVTDLSSTWESCTGLASFPLINTAAATTLNGAWHGCNGLTSFPLINTASVTVFTDAWQSCSSLTSFPAINTASGTNFFVTWAGCSGLTSFPSINTGAGTNFQGAWTGCTGLTSFPSLNFAAGTTFRDAWSGCTNLSSFPANRFDTTGTLVASAFSSAFLGCALTATSIENILTSLATNGQSNITLGLSGGTNAGASTWTTAANTAYATLLTRGWTITRNA
jgi:hypothetical protein